MSAELREQRSFFEDLGLMLTALQRDPVLLDIKTVGCHIGAALTHIFDCLVLNLDFRSWRT